MTSSPQIRRSKLNSVEVDEVHSNVGQEIIEITTDKLELILVKHIDSVVSRKEWQTPASILITIILVFCTTDFKVFAGLSPDSWVAIFIITAVISSLWLIISLFKLKKSVSINSIINAVKNKT